MGKKAGQGDCHGDQTRGVGECARTLSDDRLAHAVCGLLNKRVALWRGKNGSRYGAARAVFQKSFSQHRTLKTDTEAVLNNARMPSSSKGPPNPHRGCCPYAQRKKCLCTVSKHAPGPYPLVRRLSRQVATKAARKP